MAVRITLSTLFLAAVTPLALAASSVHLRQHVGDRASEPWPFYDPSYNYCDPGYPSAQEYSAVPDSQLEFVQIVVRHGDRSPVNLITHDDSEWNCNGVLEQIYLHEAGQNQDNTTGSFQQHIEIPSWNRKYGYENQLWKGTCDVGELTDKGKSQHHLLGTQLRSIYVDKLGYLPKELNDASEVYARTTYIWRTKNSAESLLGALWPKRGISPAVAIPLHTFPKEIETMYGNTGACPRIDTLSKNISASTQYQDFLKEQGPLLTRLASIMGVEGSSWDGGWDGYFDVLHARKCHGKAPVCTHDALPAGSSGSDRGKSCTTDQDTAQVSRNANYAWTLMYRDNPLAKELTSLTIGSFVGTLRDHMASRIAGKAGALKLALYSGHDSTVWPILAILGASNRDALWPPYASNLIFELWKKSSGDRVVRVVFNGKTLELRKEDQWCDMNACPLDRFYERLEQYIPTDIAAECK